MKGGIRLFRRFRRNGIELSTIGLYTNPQAKWQARCGENTLKLCPHIKLEF